MRTDLTPSPYTVSHVSCTSSPYHENMDAAWPITWPKVAEERHIFDPNGDVLLIFERRSKSYEAEYVEEGNMDRPAL